jgi:hypothetical protein
MSRFGRIRSSVRAAALAFLRRRTAVFFTFLFPAIIVVIFGALVGTQPAGGGLFTEPPGYYVPGYLAVVVLFTPLSRVGSEVARHREGNRFEKLATTPLRRWEWLLAQTIVNVGVIGLAALLLLGLLLATADPVRRRRCRAVLWHRYRHRFAGGLPGRCHRREQRHRAPAVVPLGDVRSPGTTPGVVPPADGSLAADVLLSWGARGDLRQPRTRRRDCPGFVRRRGPAGEPGDPDRAGARGSDRRGAVFTSNRLRKRTGRTHASTAARISAARSV